MDLFCELLIEIAETGRYIESIVRVAENHFDRFPENVKNELLVKLSETDEAASYVSRILMDNFNNLTKFFKKK